MSINIDSLIKAASAKLGMSEEQLRRAVQNGDTETVKQHLGAAEREKLDKAMNDRRVTEELKNKLRR